MILYLDTSALVKLYIREQGTDDVSRWVLEAENWSTSLITLAEAIAAFGRAVRVGAITRQTGEEATRLLGEQWPKYLKTPINEKLIVRAAELAWTLGLRGYDAVHLASAEFWQSALGAPIILVTYDRQFAEGGRRLGMQVYP